MIFRDTSCSRLPLSPFNRYIGIEVELEGWYEDDPQPSGWDGVEDGSLRNRGIEFITPPTPRHDVASTISALYDAWDEAESWEGNERTSTHVHVDVRDFNREELRTTLVVYALLEPLLMRYVGTEREENIYCVPWYRASDDLSNIAAMLDEGTRWGDIGSLLYDTCKYSALYLEPIRRFGTIEFRHAPTYDNVGELFKWVSICHDITTSGIRFNLEDVMQEVDANGVEALAEMVIGSDWLRSVNSDELMDAFDVFYVAELLLPCTYKETEGNAPWIPNMSVTENVPNITGVTEAADVMQQEYEEDYEDDEESY